MTIYEGTLDRFGYELRILSKSKKDCIEKLMAEYVRAYRNQCDDDPMVEIAYDRGSELTYYGQAREDICINEYEFGVVEWC